MPKRPLTIDDLWKLPRVAPPVPLPSGAAMIVPVSTYSLEKNRGVTRLYLVPTDAKDAGQGGTNDRARALTAADASSFQPAVSPDGKSIAFIRTPGSGSKDAKHSTVPQLYVLSLEGGEAKRVTDLPLGVQDPRWFPDGSRIAFLSPIHPSVPTPEATAEHEKALNADPVQAWVTEDRVYRFWDRWLTREAPHHIFTVDLASGKTTDLMPRSARRFDLMDPSGQYRISPDGREIVFSADRSRPPHHPLLSGVFVMKLTGKAQTPVCITSELPSHAMSPIYSPDGAWIVYGFQRRYDFYADRILLAAYERRTRRHVVLTEEWDYSPHSWSFDEKGKTLYLHAEHRGSNGIFALDFAAALRRPGKAMPERLASGFGYSAPEIAGGRLFLSRSSLSEPAEAGSLDLSGKKWIRHTAFTKPLLADIDFGRAEEITFKGAEGHRVQMYVVHPPKSAIKGPAGRGAASRKRGPLPLVHLIHGGPHGAFPNEWHWRWNAQLFASTGRIAALVNFHGSTGFGQRFCESILGRWGDQPYKDIMAATDELIERGLVDSKRMAATGGSYGGYLSGWIASQTDRFACIVNHAGCTDFQPQYGTDITQDFGPEAGGELFDGIEKIDLYSPVRHAKGFRSPMLVIHGEKDYRVPYGQGLQMYNIYKAMELPARLVIYPDENHWILKPQNSRHWYGEVFAWLDRWMSPGARRGRRR